MFQTVEMSEYGIGFFNRFFDVGAGEGVTIYVEA